MTPNRFPEFRGLSLGAETRRLTERRIVGDLHYRKVILRVDANQFGRERLEVGVRNGDRLALFDDVAVGQYVTLIVNCLARAKPPSPAARRPICSRKFIGITR
jgi:hypothetical protein